MSDAWYDRPWFKAALVLLVVGLLFALGYWLRDLLFPFILGFIVAYVFDPVIDWMEETLRLGRMPSILLFCLVVALALFLFGALLVDQTIEFAQTIAYLAQNPPPVLQRLQEWLPATVQEELRAYFPRYDAQKMIERGLQFFQQHFSSILNALNQGSTYLWLFATRTFGVVGFFINVGVFIIVTFYFLKDFDRMVNTARNLIPHRFRSQVDDVFREIDELMRAFFRGHMIVCLVIGVLYGLGYVLVGLNGGFLVGFISGLMNIIPYLGPFIGFSLALSMAFYQFGISWGVPGVILVYVAVQSLEGNILTPNLVGTAVGLNPVAVIFALMLFGKFLGFFGLLVAIPLAAIVKVLLNRLIRVYKESTYFRNRTSK